MKRKLLNFFLSIIPAAAFLIMEYAVTIIAIIAYLIFSMSLKGVGIDAAIDKITEILNDTDASTGIMIIYELFILVAYGYWHYKVTDRYEHRAVARNINWLSLVSVLFLSVGMSIVMDYITTIEDMINPVWYEVFEDMMESAGMANDMTLMALLYACIIAPVAEELIFRGLVLHYAKKAFPLWIAVIYQAVLFGAFHMNMFQGIYAFFAGLFLGFVAYYGGNIMWSVILHMLYNTVQSFPVLGFLDHSWDNIFYFMVTLAGGVLLCIVTIYWYVKGIDLKNTENKLFDEIMAGNRSGIA